MQPNTAADGFQTKYRHFSPQARIRLQNPFDHDVIYQVADEQNRPMQYNLPAHRISELPGGSVATLGLKAIIDEMIQNDDKAALSLYDLNVRARFEEKVLVSVVEAPMVTADTQTGLIDLSVGKGEQPKVEEAEKVEEAFPDVKDVAKNSLKGLKASTVLDD